ncbi:MAG: DUF4384 domain-containing protein [Ottowia sp.]|uniref:DUF4384 domain-containing protein n=1 Tax=Ottowia sp. TaxID=1898956 RepID=UPI0039E3F9B7
MWSITKTAARRSACLAAAALTGCSINPTLSDRVQTIEQATVEQAPLVAPTKSASVLREGLACMDRMLASEQVPTTLVAVKTIPDPSGLFSTATKDMLVTALSRMSRTSQAFRVVDYEIDALRQDTVQAITGLLLTSGQVELQKPQIYLSGSISFGDKSVVGKRRTLGVSTASTDTGYTTDLLGTVVGLDLHLGDMNTRTLYPGMDSANEAVVATGGTSVEIGARATGLPKHIYRLGLQYEVAADNNQGAGSAIRLLTDLAAIELVGKWARVPYWDCIDYEQNHPEFARQMRQWYEELSVADRWLLAQRVMHAEGNWPDEVNGMDTPAFRKLISRYQAANDLTPTGTINFETYTKLMRGYVGMTADGKLRSEVKTAGGELKHYAPGLPGNAPEPGVLDISLVGKRERDNAMTVGEAVVVRVVPPSTGYLYCYYQDAGQVVSQIYPNPAQPSAVAQGGRAVTVPDTSGNNPFLIEASKAGAEQVYCALSPRPLTSQLPPTFTKADLQPIAGLKSLDPVRAAFGTFKPGVAGELKWQVAPGAAKPGRGAQK